MARKKDVNKEKKEYGVTIEKDNKVHVRPIVDGEIIDTPIENIETMDELDIPISKEEVKNIVNEDNDIISLDNIPVSPLVKEEDEIIPDKFINVQQKKPISNESKIKIKNNRVYKEVGNGYGMYADTGEVFRIR